MQLSENFRVSEIFGEHQPTELELVMARALCRDLLEPLRDVFGCPLLVTDGWRSWGQVLDLRARHYSPSSTSDHSYGQSWFPFGAGAADVVRVLSGRAERFSQADYGRALAALGGPSTRRFGQLIWYSRRGHMHVSNRRDLIWGPAVLAQLPVKRATFIDEEPAG